MYYIYMWNLENVICKTEIKQMQRANLWTPRERESGMNWDIGIDIYTLLILCIKQINNENLLYISGNSTQCPVVTLMGRKSQKEYVYICTHICIYVYVHIADSLHFTVEMNTILQNNYTPIKLIFKKE